MGQYERFPSLRLNGRCSFDTVEKVGFQGAAETQVGDREWRRFGGAPHVAARGAGAGISMAILRRFWAAAARWNSSRAPFGPRNRSRSSLRMRLAWANSISTFFRSCLEVT